MPILKAALSSAYEDLEVRAGTPARSWEHCALALGVPSSPPPGRTMEGNAIDRVIRAMRGQGEWLLLCLAQPISDDGGLEAIVADLGREQAALESPTPMGAPGKNPILKAALEEQLERAQACQVTGAWRTALYLSAEKVAPLGPRASVASMFLDPGQKVDPLRTFAPERTQDLAPLVEDGRCPTSRSTTEAPSATSGGSPTSRCSAARIWPVTCNCPTSRCRGSR